MLSLVDGDYKCIWADVGGKIFIELFLCKGPLKKLTKFIACNTFLESKITTSKYEQRVQSIKQRAIKEQHKQSNISSCMYIYSMSSNPGEARTKDL